ncbi:hypothetical protein GCM10007867_27530 [Gluconobacter cerinus]|uniref:Transposase n=1 Tax=Gluconobacter cerinus TaxID=38307 RepID=A0AAV5NHJ7_9PROT|nr:hypothetical protein GCM10007867_27530 [Gluconobacter cerinus]
MAHEAAGVLWCDERLARLSGLGDQLEAFSPTVDFEAFRPDLEKALAYSDRSKGGRPPFDPVLMIKILVIQTLNNLSDERTEYLINDRLSFMRFLGLGLSDRVPDAKTVWLVRHVIRPVLDPEETAIRQVERLGFYPTDVRHILLTHFDIDHIGGLSDFPRAQVHLSAAEAQGAIHHPSFTERQRYHPLQWAYGPAIVEHVLGNDVWRSFSGVKALLETSRLVC